MLIPAGQAQGIDPRTQPGQERGHQRQRAQRHDRDGRHRPQRQLPEDAGIDQEQTRQREEDRQPGEEDGPAGGRGRRRDREPGIGAPDQLLPETVDDEQRVVDADAEPDHGGDVRDEQVELGECRRRAEHAEGDDHPGHRQHQRQTGRDHGARGDQQDQERDRKPQPLRPREILLLLGDQLGDQRRATGDVDANLVRRRRRGRLGQPRSQRLPVRVGPAQPDDRRGDMTLFGDQTLGARIERRDDADDAGELLHAIERRTDDGLECEIGRDEALRFEDDEILLGEWLVEPRCQDLLRAIGVGGENIERGARDRRLKARHQERAADDDDDPDGDDEPVVARHGRAEPGKRRASREETPGDWGLGTPKGLDRGPGPQAEGDPA